MGIDSGETGDVLADLLEELKSLVLAFHDSGHTTKSGALELLASIETVAELEEADIVLGDLVDEVASGAELAQGELVMILVVEHIEEGGKEGVEILQGKVSETVPHVLRCILRPRVYYTVLSATCRIKERLTSMIGNSSRIDPSFSSNESWVNLTLRI